VRPLFGKVGCASVKFKLNVVRPLFDFITITPLPVINHPRRS
jgi:hypothetical protein